MAFGPCLTKKIFQISQILGLKGPKSDSYLTKFSLISAFPSQIYVKKAKHLINFYGKYNGFQYKKSP